jgi:Pyruvate/2-oxoacid:ferredoxin oxidoreductase delta subunit
MGRVLSGGMHFSAGSLICLLLGVLLLPLSIGYLVWARFFLPKLFFASARCSGCGQCAKRCPFHAIRMPGGKKPRPYWTWRCESCMRCMAYCPTQAIEAGHSWGALLFFISYLPAVLWVFGGIVSPAIGAWLDSPWLRWIAQYAYFLAAISAAYFVFNLLVRIPFINTLFTYTTFTRVFPRYHEPDTEVDEM